MNHLRTIRAASEDLAAAEKGLREGSGKLELSPDSALPDLVKARNAALRAASALDLLARTALDGIRPASAAELSRMAILGAHAGN
jgi:hypothetical protein